MQKGGLVKKNGDVTNFEAFMNMLNNERAEITKISFDSLFGFIFKLHVPNIEECEQQFYGLNENKTDFDAPIDTLVIKMSILDEKSKLDGLILGEKNIKKKSDKLENFKNEAILQSNIYSNSLIYGDPLCPCLLDLFILNTPSTTSVFLDACLSKCKDEESKTVINWLFKICERGSNKLGIIAMQSAVEYSIYETYYDSFRDDKEKRKKLKTTLLTKTIRLYNECKVIHCDLHMGNSLVKQNDDGSFVIYLIDFGRFVKTGNNNVIKTFDDKTIRGILTFCVNQEILYNKKQGFDDTSSFMETLYLKHYSLKELVDSLNAFYSLRIHKYKTLSPGDFIQTHVNNSQFQCKIPLILSPSYQSGLDEDVSLPPPVPSFTPPVTPKFETKPVASNQSSTQSGRPRFTLRQSNGGGTYKRKPPKTIRKRKRIRRKSIKRRR